jgi:hypothetical protein
MHRPGAKPDTGTIRSDLSNLLKELVQFVNRRDGGKVFMAFLNEALRNPKLAAANQKITHEVRASYVAVIEQAIERGELAPDTDVELMIDMLISPFIYRQLTGNGKVEAIGIEPLLDRVLSAFSGS